MSIFRTEPGRFSAFFCKGGKMGLLLLLSSPYSEDELSSFFFFFFFFFLDFFTFFSFAGSTFTAGAALDPEAVELTTPLDLSCTACTRARPTVSFFLFFLSPSAGAAFLDSSPELIQVTSAAILLGVLGFRKTPGLDGITTGASWNCTDLPSPPEPRAWLPTRRFLSCASRWGPVRLPSWPGPSGPTPPGSTGGGPRAAFSSRALRPSRNFSISFWTLLSTKPAENWPRGQYVKPARWMPASTSQALGWSGQIWIFFFCRFSIVEP